MLESLFTSKARVKILETFLLNRDSEFHIRELARRTGISPPYVMKELHNLKDLGILIEKRQGNMVFYRINKSASIVEELRKIFLKTEGVAPELFELLKKERNRIRYALVYGSFAKGTEVASSDIDLLIVGEIDEDKAAHLMMKAQSRIGREINYVIWSERAFAEKSGQKIPLLREISKNPVIMIIGDTDDFKRSIKEQADRKI
jgi:DNA-binding transcriptional ArsR family regulator